VLNLVLKIVLLLFTFYSFVFCKELSTLAGDLPRVITAAGSPYIVISDIFVPAGKVVRIEPGVVLLFKNFTGIHVRGMLIARGSATRPVVFTSENDQIHNPLSKLNPTPYDWNGMYIQKDGIGTDLEYVKLMYSVKGIVTETKFIRIAGGVFSENGRSNLTIEGEEILVQSLVPFTHNLSIKDATIDGVPVKILHDPEAVKRNVFRYTGFVMTVGGGVLSSYFGYKYNKARKEINRLEALTVENLSVKDGSSRYIKKQKERDRSIIITSAGGVALSVGSIMLTYSFTF
jgi:hypothetical protein